MCEDNQVGQLLNFGFVGFQKDVEDRLRFKAQHSDPLKAPHYHQVLYSWHVTRGDYRSGEHNLIGADDFSNDSCRRHVPAGQAARGYPKD